MDKQTLALLIPFISIVMGISIPLTAIILHFMKRRQILEQFHKERMAAIEKGIEIPEIPAEAFCETGETPSRGGRHGILLAGLIATFLGVALYFVINNFRPDRALVALFPIGLGLAFLMYYGAVGRKLAAKADAEYEAEKTAKLAKAARRASA